MPSLSEIQERLREALIAPGGPAAYPIGGNAAGDAYLENGAQGVPASTAAHSENGAQSKPGATRLDDIFGRTARRFHVHHRHFTQSLTGILEKTFPGVVKLVDKRFFAYMADAFIRSHPPASPCLFEYGGALADFLDGFPACKNFPYLGDVARFEWAVHCAFHAPDGAKPDAVFRTCVIHFTSAWPVYAIWRVAVGRDEGPIDVSAGRAHLLIYLAGEDVLVEALDEAEFAFQCAFAECKDLESAANAIIKAFPEFDADAAVRRLSDNLHLLVRPRR